MIVLLDTNVLIDYFAKREPHYHDAFRLRVMQEFGDIELWAAVQSFSDIAYVLRKNVDSDSLQDSFSASLGFLHVCSLDQNDLKNAYNEKWADLEDCLIEQCARKIKAEFVLARDSEGFAKSGATVLSPAKFFALIAEQYGLTYDDISL
jgi:predicted nucleic acid-binding protein